MHRLAVTVSDLQKLPPRPEALQASVQSLIDRGVTTPLKTTRPAAGGGVGQMLPRVRSASLAVGSGDAWGEHDPAVRCEAADAATVVTVDCTKQEAAVLPSAALRSHGRRHDLPKRPGSGVRSKGK